MKNEPRVLLSPNTLLKWYSCSVSICIRANSKISNELILMAQTQHNNCAKERRLEKPNGHNNIFTHNNG